MSFSIGMASYTVALCLLLVLHTGMASNAKYTSEETSEKSKSMFNAFSSVIGSTENSRQQHTRTYDQPSYNPNSAGHTGVSMVHHNWPATHDLKGYHGSTYESSGNGLSAAGGAVRAEHSQLSPVHGSSMPRQQTDIDYPRALLGTRDFDAAVTGAGNIDVRTSVSPSAQTVQQPYPRPPCYPFNSICGSGGLGNTLPGVHYPPPGYPYPPRGGPRWEEDTLPPSTYRYPAPPDYPPPYGSHARHDNQPQQPSGYLTAHAYGNQPHNRYEHGQRSDNHLDHSFKMKTEYKEDGHHEGPFQGHTGYGYGNGYGGGYNGAFNRPFYY